MNFCFTNGVSLAYSSKFGDGSKVNENIDNDIISDFQYFENLLDVNYFYNDNLQIFTQIEYTSPPLLGFYNNQINHKD